jgi:sugar lactone lactonase YvrE
LAAVILSIVSIVSGRAQAAELYATSIAGSQIDKVDTVANTVTTYLNTPSAADSIMFDSTQRVIYTQLFSGQVRRFDPTNSTDVAIAGGFNEPADITLEPGGQTMLVSEFLGGKIDRVNLTTNAVSTLLAPGANPEGLAYDGARLFANLGSRSGGPTGKFVAEINPTTGAILATSPDLDSLDGLTFDPYTGLLYATSVFGNLVYSIDPNNLSVVHDVTSKIGSIPGPDGITTDGVGNIYIASSGSLGDSHIYQLDLINQTLTQKTFVNGLDDLAPLSGLGSIPEPSSFVLAGFGFAVLAAWHWRRRKR